jgi:hypothetical protein
MNEFDYKVNRFWSDKLSRRYKGGDDPPPPQGGYITPSANAQWAKDTTFPLVTNAIEGRGFGTDVFSARQRNRARTGLQESFDTTKSETMSQMDRSLRPEDTRVRNFVGASLDRAYTTAQDQQNRGFRASDVADKSMGMEMAGTMLSNEQQMAVSGAQAYNNALSANMQMTNRMGTFGTNIAAGVGQGMMDYNYAQKMGAQ